MAFRHLVLVLSVTATEPLSSFAAIPSGKQLERNDNFDVPISERSFARRFKERSADYGMTYDKNISVGNGRFCRGFRGVHVKVRTKDVNY